MEADPLFADKTQYTGDQFEHWWLEAKVSGLNVRKETVTKTMIRYIALHPQRGIVGYFHTGGGGHLDNSVLS